MELFSRIDLWIIGLYLLGMLAIGWRVSGETKDLESFTVGNRAMPGWAVGMSVLGTFLSSITFLALPAKTFTDSNWNAAIFGLMPPVAALLAVVWLVPLYRRQARMSAYELLELRFGYWARAFAAVSFVAAQLLRIGMVQLLVAYAVEPLVDWPRPEGWEPAAWYQAKVVALLCISGGVVIVYDVLGGIQAVVWTDVMQVIVLSIGAVWCLGELIWSWPGGWTEYLERFPRDRIQLTPWTNATDAGWDWGVGSVLVMAVYGLAENLKNYGADQQYVQRMLCARDDAAAKRSLWIGAWGYVPLNIVFCLIGTSLWAYYHHADHALPAGLANDAVFPYFIRHELPLPVTGLVVAAILAAAMSTIDSGMNSSAMTIYTDLVQRLRGNRANRWEMAILRTATVGMGVFGSAVAILIFFSLDRNEATVLMETWWKYIGIVGAGLFGLFLIAWLLPKTPPKIAAFALVCAAPVLIWGNFARKLPADSFWHAYECPLHPNLIGVTASLTMLAIATAAHLLTPRRAPA